MVLRYGLSVVQPMESFSQHLCSLRRNLIKILNSLESFRGWPLLPGYQRYAWICTWNLLANLLEIHRSSLHFGEASLPSSWKAFLSFLLKCYLRKITVSLLQKCDAPHVHPLLFLEYHDFWICHVRANNLRRVCVPLVGQPHRLGYCWIFYFVHAHSGCNPNLQDTGIATRGKVCQQRQSKKAWKRTTSSLSSNGTSEHTFSRVFFRGYVFWRRRGRIHRNATWLSTERRHLETA